MNVLDNPAALVRIIAEQDGFSNNESASQPVSETESSSESSSDDGQSSEASFTSESSEFSSDEFLSDNFIDEDFLKGYNPASIIDAKHYELITLRKSMDTLPGLIADDDRPLLKECLQEMLDCISTIRLLDQAQFDHQIPDDGNKGSLAENCSTFGFFANNPPIKQDEPLNEQAYAAIIKSELNKSKNDTELDRLELKASFVNDIQREHNAGGLTINGKPLPIPHRVALNYEQWKAVLIKCGLNKLQVRTLLESFPQKSQANLISLFGNALEGHLATNNTVCDTFGFLKLKIENQLDISIIDPEEEESIDTEENKSIAPDENKSIAPDENKSIAPDKNKKLIFTQKGTVKFQSPPSPTSTGRGFEETTEAEAEFSLEVKLNSLNADDSVESLIEDVQLKIDKLVNVGAESEHDCAKIIKEALESSLIVQNHAVLN